MRTVTSFRLCRLAPTTSIRGPFASTARRGARGCRSGSPRKRPVTESGLRISSSAEPAAITCPPSLPAPGPRSMTCSARRMVSSSCSTTTSVLPFASQLRERVEQDAVVARVEADGGLVEDVADAAQVRAELRGQPDPLRFAAGERRGGAVESEIPEADLPQKAQPRAELGQEVARDLRFTDTEVEALAERRDPARPAARSSRLWSDRESERAAPSG